MRMAPPEIVDRLSIDYHMWNAYVDGRLSALAEPVRIPRRCVSGGGGRYP